MIRWDPAGEHIIVERPEQLALHVLPSVYRQSRFASFSRQLNVSHRFVLFFPHPPPPLRLPCQTPPPVKQLILTHLLTHSRVCVPASRPNRSTVSCERSICATSTPPSTTLTRVLGVSHYQ